MEMISNQAADIAVLEALISDDTITPGVYDGAEWGLTQSDITIDRNTTIVDLEAIEADFANYSRHPVTWNNPTVSDDGFVESIGSVSFWQPLNDDTPNTIWAAFLVLGNGSLGFAARFDNPPLPMGTALDQITINPRVRPSVAGPVVVIS